MENKEINLDALETLAEAFEAGNSSV